MVAVEGEEADPAEGEVVSEVAEEVELDEEVEVKTKRFVVEAGGEQLETEMD